MAESRMGNLVDRVPGWVVPTLLLGVPAIMAFLGWYSDEFYYNVIWRYYWGPIVTDGSEASELIRGGVASEAGYNPVNTISWAILLFVCLLGIGQLLRRYEVEMDAKLTLAATSWVVTGSVFHVLQDSQLIRQPLEFLFITPPIWLAYGAFGVGSMALGVYFRHVQRATGSLHQAMQKVWFLFMIFVLGYTFLWVTQWNMLAAYVNPIYVALSAVVAYFATRWLAMRDGEIQPWHTCFTFSIGWFLTAMTFYVIYWFEQPWPGKTPSSDLSYVLWLVPLLAAAVAALVYGAGRLFMKWGKESAVAYTVPINLFIVFSQMVDAFSTGVGVDLSGYTEKHVLSEGLRAGFQDLSRNIGFEQGVLYPTFLGFAPVKLIVSLLVIYAIDISGKEDMKRYPTMMMLIKFAVIMVGIGPGLRNSLRMALGI